MKLRIVAINDVYVLDRLPRLATLIRRAREVDPADALLVTLAGDFLSPSLLSSIDAGRSMVDCMNAIGVTHLTFGNHEDDLAAHDLRARTLEVTGKWLATNVRDLEPSLPVSDVIEVAGVRVGLLGVVMNDAAVYRHPPFGGVAVEDPIAAALREAAALRARGCDVVIPLTHQFVVADRALAAAQREPPFPVILGGHEHAGIMEYVEGTWIIKAKADAENAAVIDVTTDAPDRSDVRAVVRLEPVSGYEEDPAIRELVDRHMKLVRDLEAATLFRIPDGEVLSSIGTRSMQTSLGSLLVSRIRDVLDADVAVLNGGGVRGSREYTNRFTYGALRAEVPFDNEMVVVPIPGAVLAEVVAFSRARAPVEYGGFLQVDDRVLVADGTNELVAVAGAPFDPSREYRVALVRNFFDGLDGIEPFVRFAKEHPTRIPRVDSGRDVRLVLVCAFARDIWRKLGGFAAIDVDGDGSVTPAEVAAALEHARGERAQEATAGLVVTTLDRDHDGVISREEGAEAD